MWQFYIKIPFTLRILLLELKLNPRDLLPNLLVIRSMWRCFWKSRHPTLQFRSYWGIPEERSQESFIYLFTLKLACLESTTPACCKIKKDVRWSELNIYGSLQHRDQRTPGHTMVCEHQHKCLSLRVSRSRTLFSTLSTHVNCKRVI